MLDAILSYSVLWACLAGVGFCLACVVALIRKRNIRGDYFSLPCATRVVLLILAVSAAVRCVPKVTNGLDRISAPSGLLSVSGNRMEDSVDDPVPVDDVVRFSDIAITTNGVELVLHRPVTQTNEDVTVVLVGSTNLTAATWTPFMTVEFPAGETNVPVTVYGYLLGQHAVSNSCFFAFINAGDTDGDGLEDWDERFNLGTDPTNAWSAIERIIAETGYAPDYPHAFPDAVAYRFEGHAPDEVLDDGLTVYDHVFYSGAWNGEVSNPPVVGEGGAIVEVAVECPEVDGYGVLTIGEWHLPLIPGLSTTFLCSLPPNTWSEMRLEYDSNWGYGVNELPIAEIVDSDSFLLGDYWPVAPGQSGQFYWPVPFPQHDICIHDLRTGLAHVEFCGIGENLGGLEISWVPIGETNDFILVDSTDPGLGPLAVDVAASFPSWEERRCCLGYSHPLYVCGPTNMEVGIHFCPKPSSRYWMYYTMPSTYFSAVESPWSYERLLCSCCDSPEAVEPCDCHALCFSFDIDGDGLENSVDPDPYVAGPGAHGTNAEWYNVVCSNVFWAVEGENGIELAPRTPDVDTNAYYFVDILVADGFAPIYFNASQPGRLGSPVVISYPERPIRVPLLIGVEYEVTSPVPFSPIVPGVVVVETLDCNAYKICWPLNFSFTEDGSGPSRSYLVGVEPFVSSGIFSWEHEHGGAQLQSVMPLENGGGACGCVSGNGNRIVFGCSPSCTCGGTCSAIGVYHMEHALFAVTGGVCHCGITEFREDDPEVQVSTDRLSLELPPTLLLKSSWMPGSRSLEATISLELVNRSSGELHIWLESGLGKVFMPAGVDRRIPLFDVHTWSCSFVIDGIETSREVGDICLGCSFNGLVATATTTVVSPLRVELPTAPITGMVVLQGTAIPACVVLEPVVRDLEIEWYTSRRKHMQLYDPWVCVGRGQSNVSLATPNSGIYALCSRIICGTQSNQVEYVHLVGERSSDVGKEALGPNKAGMRNHFGVTATQLLLDIRNKALDYMESTTYAYSSFLPTRNGFTAIPEGKWKCNAFVADVAIQAGAMVQPINPRKGLLSGRYYPPSANDWADGGTSIPGWIHLGREVYPEPGFIVGFPNGEGSGHVGIVDYDGWTISARPNAVTRNARKMLDSRCGYNRPVENNE